MPNRCANPSCCSNRKSREGTMFRLDIELGDLAGRETREYTYIWLCSRCAGTMKPAVEVTRHAVRIRLSAIHKAPASTCSTAVN